MERSTKEAWLQGPSDLLEATVDDVPVEGLSVRVRGLPAAYSNRAASNALKLVTGKRGEQTATVDKERLEIIQFAAGCVDPTFTEDEAAVIAKKYGPAFNKVIAKIDELSGVDKEAIERTEATFQAGGAAPAGENVGNGVAAVDSGPDLHVRTGA
jgi:gamma-glutamylcyclotransferase (GGCT)/AIG2-like uncharacterized protein YtfP